MQKLLFLILTILLFSCEKKTYFQCWECEIKIAKIPIHIDTYCDKTKEEIKNIEQKGTFYLYKEGYHITTCKLQ